jgi:hypothetical protein
MLRTNEQGNGDGKLGYRVLRSTVVLAEHSKAIEEIRDTKLTRVVNKVHRVNFDFEQLTERDLEVLYAYFDDEFMDLVKEEFRFIPRRGAIRDNKGRVGICYLCGKGDSKDEGDNEDNLRYEFLLSNIGGGKDVWTGSTCIVNYGLKVQGAATGEEAKKILQKTLREHIRQWEIEEWQAENGDHEQIPDQYQEFRRLPFKMRSYGEIYTNFGELQLAGFDVDELRNQTDSRHQLFRDFRTASRFYGRKSFLTDKKMETWEKAKAVLADFRAIQVAVESGADIPDSDKRIDHFVKLGKKRAKSAKKPKRSRG